MTVLDEIAEAKRRATMQWLLEGAKDSLHMRQVYAAEDVVVRELEKRRLELLGPAAPVASATKRRRPAKPG